MKIHSVRTLVPRPSALWLAFIAGLLAAVIASGAVASIRLHQDAGDAGEDAALPPSSARVLVMKDGVRVHLPANFYFYNAATQEHPDAVVIAKGDPTHPVSSASWDYSGKTPAVLDWNVAKADETTFAKFQDELSATPPDSYVYNPQPGELYQEAPTPTLDPPTDPTFPPYDARADLSEPFNEARGATIMGVPVELPPGFTAIDVVADVLGQLDKDGTAISAGGARHLVWVQARSNEDGYKTVVAQVGWDVDTGEFLGHVPESLDDSLGQIAREVNQKLGN